MADVSKVVLITGCSTGIGRATAERLVDRGYTVYATARRPESIADLGQRGCRTLALDVTDEASMTAAVAEVEGAEGAVGALVNNAGYSQSGAVESVPIDSVRAQFETNVFGLLRMCQLVLPGMRRQRSGRIVNVSSMGGKLTFPGGGVYHATKHAVEALSDAMRFEVKGFGVHVSIIEPGLIKTHFAEAAVGSIAQDDGPYDKFNKAVAESTAGVYEGPLGKLGGGPEAVAKAIERAISSGRPRTRYPVTLSARMLPGAAGAASRPRLGRHGRYLLSTPRRLRELLAANRERSDQLAYFTDEAEVYAYIGRLFQDLCRRGAWPEVPQGEHDRPVPLPRTPIADYGRADGGRQGRVECGPTDMEPEVVMTMDADTAHRFWLGHVNVTVALARGQIKARGPVAKILKLVPLVKPVFPRYRAMLQESGREDLLEAA